MFPVIFSLGPFTLYSYGLMMFIGFAIGLFLVWKKTREEHFEADEVFDVVTVVGFWSLLGARIGYIVFHLDQFGLNPWEWINIFGKPGLTFFGGWLLGVWMLYRQCRARKWDFYELADLLVPGLVVMMIFGWLGAFLNGSSFGLPTESILGVRFVGMFDKRLPVQLMAALLYMLVFWFVAWAEGRYRTFEWYRAGRSGVNAGFLAYSFLAFLGIIQTAVAWMSPPAMVVAGVEIGRLIWPLLVMAGLVGLYQRSGREWDKDVKVLGIHRERVEKRRERRWW